MVECGRGCQLPLHSTVGKMHGEPCDTECNACKTMPLDHRGGQVNWTGGGEMREQE